MKSVFLGVVALLCALPLAFAVVGVDVSAPVSESSFACMKGQHGVEFAIVRCWHSTGTPDTAAPATVSHAWSAGLAHVDVYMFPCYKCGDGKGQVNKAVSYLRSNNVRYGMLWLDIEGPGTYWSSSTTNNVNFINDMISEGRSLGVTLGIYTSASQWNPITGDWKGASSYPLWYAHYNSQQNFNDFSPFGGWTHPAIKQYAGDTTLCSSGVDLNWYP